MLDLSVLSVRFFNESFVFLLLLQYLRDPDGNLYSSSQYSLQQSADGSVYLLPRDRKGSSSQSMNPDYGRSQNQNHTQDG